MVPANCEMGAKQHLTRIINIFVNKDNYDRGESSAKRDLSPWCIRLDQESLVDIHRLVSSSLKYKR